MKDIIGKLIEETVKKNLRIEIVEWYGDTFSIRLFWGNTMFFESSSSDGKLTNR